MLIEVIGKENLTVFVTNEDHTTTVLAVRTCYREKLRIFIVAVTIILPFWKIKFLHSNREPNTTNNINNNIDNGVPLPSPSAF